MVNIHPLHSNGVGEVPAPLSAGSAPAASKPVYAASSSSTHSLENVVEILSQPEPAIEDAVRQHIDSALLTSEESRVGARKFHFASVFFSEKLEGAMAAHHHFHGQRRLALRDFHKARTLSDLSRMAKAQYVYHINGVNPRVDGVVVKIWMNLQGKLSCAIEGSREKFIVSSDGDTENASSLSGRIRLVPTDLEYHFKLEMDAPGFDRLSPEVHLPAPGYNQRLQSLCADYRALLKDQIGMEEMAENNIFQAIKGEYTVIASRDPHGIPLAFPHVLIRSLENQMPANTPAPSYTFSQKKGRYELILRFSNGTVDCGKFVIASFDAETLKAFSIPSFRRNEEAAVDENEAKLLVMYAGFVEGMGLPGDQTMALAPAERRWPGCYLLLKNCPSKAIDYCSQHYTEAVSQQAMEASKGGALVVSLQNKEIVNRYGRLISGVEGVHKHMQQSLLAPVAASSAASSVPVEEEADSAIIDAIAEAIEEFDNCVTQVINGKTDTFSSLNDAMGMHLGVIKQHKDSKEIKEVVDSYGHYIVEVLGKMINLFDPVVENGIKEKLKASGSCNEESIEAFFVNIRRMMEIFNAFILGMNESEELSLQDEGSPVISQASTSAPQQVKPYLPSPELYRHPYFFHFEPFNNHPEYKYSSNPNFESVLTEVNEKIEGQPWKILLNRFAMNPNDLKDKIVEERDCLMAARQKKLRAKEEQAEYEILLAPPTAHKKNAAASASSVGVPPPPPPPPGAPPPPPGAPPLPPSHGKGKGKGQVEEVRLTDEQEAQFRKAQQMLELNDKFQSAKQSYENAALEYDRAKSDLTKLLFPFHDKIALICDPFEQEEVAAGQTVLFMDQWERVVDTIFQDLTQLPAFKKTENHSNLSKAETSFISNLKTKQSNLLKCNNLIKKYNKQIENLPGNLKRAINHFKIASNNHSNAPSAETLQNYMEATKKLGSLKKEQEELPSIKEKLIDEENKFKSQLESINSLIKGDAGDYDSMRDLISETITKIQNKEPVPFEIQDLQGHLANSLSTKFTTVMRNGDSDDEDPEWQ